jgi:hypothetical protein
MAVFKDAEQLKDMMADLWTKMVKETPFGKGLEENGINILFIVEDPDLTVFIDHNGVLFGEEAMARTPVVTMKQSGDTVHKYWLKQINVPKAMATRQIKSKGPIAKALALQPLLKPGFAIYREMCKKYNLPLE